MQEVESLLINRMKLGHQKIHDNQIFPMTSMSHPKAREYMLAVKRNDLKAVRDLLMFTS
jgi:hypothetical protein